MPHVWLNRGGFPLQRAELITFKYRLVVARGTVIAILEFPTERLVPPCVSRGALGVPSDGRNPAVLPPRTSGHGPALGSIVSRLMHVGLCLSVLHVTVAPNRSFFFSFRFLRFLVGVFLEDELAQGLPVQRSLGLLLSAMESLALGRPARP